MLKAARFVLVVATLALGPAFLARAQTVTFDFDTGVPVFSIGQNTPFDQVAGGVTAHFSSPTDPAFSIQTDTSTGWHMSQFSGRYLYDNNLNPNVLNIKFSRPVTAITFTFATADFQQVEVPTTIQVTAYMDSKTTPPVGSASGHGTYATDTMPMGTLTLNTGTQAFNLVQIAIPPQPLGATDFFVDNITVTLGPPATPVLTAPANAVTGVLTSPVLTWNAASGATSYDVYFGTLSSPPLVTNTTATSYAPGTLSPNTLYYWQIVAQNSSGSSSSATWSFTTGTTGGATAGLQFLPVTPCRVADTRGAPGPFGKPALTANSTRSFVIPQSGCGIPATAQAYSLNVTVVPQGPLQYLALWPAGLAQPGVSTLNSSGGIVVANAAIVPAGTGGAVNVFVTDPTEVILDIDGYFDTPGPATQSFYPATPCRVVDTRWPAGSLNGPSMSAGETREFPFATSPCVPAAASAYSLNVTVVPDPIVHYLGYLATWPAGQQQPGVSTLNSWTGRVVANAAIVPSGTNGSIMVYVTQPTNVILDIDGYFAAPGSPGALSFYPLTPCRIADTRNAAGPFGGPALAAGVARSFAIPASSCYVPTTAAAYAVNVTVVPHGYLGYLTLWPAGAMQPGVSITNSWDGSVVANAAIVQAGTNGAISFFAPQSTDVVLDINGYFAP
jgi:hypothetical protein